jgi:hypothetical protein
MKLLRTVLLAAILCGPGFIAKAEDASKVIWYCFELERGGTVAATSALAPGDLARDLGGAGFVRLDNVRHANGAGQWVAPEAPYTGTLFVRPQTVRSFYLLSGPPKDAEPKDAQPKP